MNASRLLRAAPELSTLRVLCSTLEAVADLVDAVHPRLTRAGPVGPGDEVASRLTVALGMCAAAAEDYREQVVQALQEGEEEADLF
jgi:hypothetical protein